MLALEGDPFWQSGRGSIEGKGGASLVEFEVERRGTNFESSEAERDGTTGKGGKLLFSFEVGRRGTNGEVGGTDTDEEDIEVIRFGSIICRGCT